MQAIRCSICFCDEVFWLEVQADVDADMEDVLEGVSMLTAWDIWQAPLILPNHAKWRGRLYRWLSVVWL